LLLLSVQVGESASLTPKVPERRKAQHYQEAAEENAPVHWFGRPGGGTPGGALPGCGTGAACVGCVGGSK
jgi:hypothetical protein